MKHNGSLRDGAFTKGPADVLDHATSEIASGSKHGIAATKKLPSEVGANLQMIGLNTSSTGDMSMHFKPEQFI